MKFEDKVKEILEKHTHISHDDWYGICFALFLEYRFEKSLVDQFFRNENERRFLSASHPFNKTFL